MTNFDKTEDYKEKVKPAVEELRRAAMLTNLPIFITVAVSNSESETKYESEIITPASKNIELKEDMFPKLANVMNGFETIPKRELTEIKIPTERKVKRLPRPDEIDF